MSATSTAVKFGACKSVDGVFLGKWVKYMPNHLNNLCLFSLWTHLSTNFHAWWLYNDADLRMCVPFGGFIDIAPHLAGEIPSPKKP